MNKVKVKSKTKDVLNLLNKNWKKLYETHTQEWVFNSFRCWHDPWMQKSLYSSRQGFFFLPLPFPLPFFFPFFVFFSVVGITDGCLGLVENATVEKERVVMSVYDDLILYNSLTHSYIHVFTSISCGSIRHFVLLLFLILK